MAIGKTIALTRQTFVGKVISLHYNMLSRLVIAFLPRRNCLKLKLVNVERMADVVLGKRSVLFIISLFIKVYIRIIS